MMTSIVDKYYRKISENIDNVRMKFDISTLLVKSKEQDNKFENIYDKDYIDNNFLIESEIDDKDNKILTKVNDHFYSRSYINDNYYIKNNVYDKDYIDNNFLIESEIDKKDNEILNKVNNYYYSRSYINDNYYIKNNVYDKDYIDNNFYTKQDVLNITSQYYLKKYLYDKDYIDNSFLIESEIDKKLNNFYLRSYINDNYYNKNELNNNFNNLYNRTYLDNKFDNIYTKTEVNDKTAKLDRNIVLFNQNLTKFIDKTYKNKITELENNKLTETQITKINQLENIDLNKMRYYIKEFIPFNITLVRKFTFIGNINEIMILQFELDQRTFDIDDVINFFLNITIQFDNFKNNWYRLKLRLDILYDDETQIKSFIKMPISKGFIYHHLMNFNINRFFKLSKKTEKIIFKIYICKINTALVDNIVFNLNQKYENDFCDIIYYKIV